MATRTLLTTEQYAQMQTSEMEDYELVDGELIPLPSAIPLHNKIRRRLERFLEDFFLRNPLGELYDEMDCRISDGNIRRPDLSVFLHNPKRQIDVMRVPIPFAPDIAVEVLSPSEVAIDVNRKVRDYLSAGSKEVWILDHVNSELFIHTDSQIRLLKAQDALESPLLPGFSAPVSDLLTSS